MAMDVFDFDLQRSTVTRGREAEMSRLRSDAEIIGGFVMRVLQVLFAVCLIGLAMAPNAAWSASRGACFDAAHAKYGDPNIGTNRSVIRHAVRRCLRHGLGAV
jgi:hypothetical protein